MSMKITSRRELFTLTMAGLLSSCTLVNPVPVPVPAPTPSPSPIIPSTLLEDVNLIIGALQRALPLLQPILPTGLYAQLANYINTAVSIAQALTNAATAGDLNAQLGAFVQAIQQALGLLSGNFGVSIPAWLSTVLAAVQVLLPIILSFTTVGTRALAVSDPREASARNRLRAFISTGR